MKDGDKVRVTADSPEYLKDDVHCGDIGYICLSEIRNNTFYVEFETGDIHNWYKYCEIKINDLELVEQSDYTDEDILEGLPNNDPRWWCKVENGYIMNLNGDKKNKIPYDYNS